MRYSSFRIDESDFDSRRPTIETAGGWWVRFGDEVLTYAANNRWSGVEDGVGAQNRSARQPAGDVKKSDMHLVVQKGRTFQQEHPEVEVLFDRGRYLVVALPKAQAKKLNKTGEVCFHIAPLDENTVVFETASRARSAAAAAGAEAEVVAKVDQARFDATIAHLVSYPTRLSTSPHYNDAAEWCRAQFTALGYDAQLEPVNMPGGGASKNVVAKRTGVGMAGRGEVIVVAHLDSVNHPGGPQSDAPGADDNASGSAGALVLAAALAGHESAHDLTFILFGGEEQGLHGSTQYVAGMDPAARDRVRAVLNMDMIGSVNATPPAVLLEGHPTSQAMIDALAQAAADFTTLTVQTSLNPFASDHVPFIQNGMPAVLTIEGADSANDAIHTINDTLDRVNSDFACQILRMNAGWLAAEAGAIQQAMPGGYGQPVPPPLPHPVPPPMPFPEVPPDLIPAPLPAPPQPTGADPAQLARDLAFHYQALLAQYARLGRDGRLTPQDYAAWQATHAAHEALSQYRTAGKGGCGCGCGGCS